MLKETLIGSGVARMLARIALLAAWEGQRDVAERIFSALQAAMPKDVNVRVCRAMVWACQDRYYESIALLRKILHDDPRNVSAKGLLGFVLFSIGESGWQAMLEEVVDDGSDRAAVELAQRIFSEHQEYRKCTPSTDFSNTHLIAYA